MKALIRGVLCALLLTTAASATDAPVTSAGASGDLVSGNLTKATGTHKVTDSGLPSAAQGNGSKVQLSTGPATPTDGIAKYDANGNVVNSGLPSAAQGNGSKVQLSTGSTTTGDLVKYDANGNAVDSGSAGAPTIGTAGGDLGGSYPNPTVTGVGHITTGILGTANGGTGNSAGTAPPSGSAGGDLGGSYPNPTVAKVNGNTPGNTCSTGPQQFNISIDTSARGACAQVKTSDVDPLAASNGDSNYSMSSTKRYFTVSAALTAARTWTWLAASSVQTGEPVTLSDPNNYISAVNPLIIVANGSDTFQNGATSITLTAPNQTVIGKKTGSGSWDLKVTSPSTNGLDFQRDFGGVPITANGDQGMTWTSGSQTISNMNHTWTAAEVASITTDIAGAHKWKVILQYSDTSQVDLHTYIDVAPTVGLSSFHVAVAPNTTNQATTGTRLNSISGITVQAGGSHVQAGATATFPYGGSGSSYAAITGKFSVIALNSVPSIRAAGSAGTNGTWPCSLNMPLSKVLLPIGATTGTYVENGAQATGTCTVSGPGTLTAFAVTGGGRYHNIAATYTYDGSGRYEGLPVSCPQCNLSGSPTVDGDFAAVEMTDSAGTDASSGVFQGSTSSWCSAGTPDTESSGTDHSTGVTISCARQLVQGWVYYDNNSNIVNATKYLNTLPAWQRPTVRVGGVFGTSPVAASTGGNCDNCSQGPQSWAGIAEFRSGFFVSSPGSYGQVFPVYKASSLGSDNNNGFSETDATHPDWSGFRLADMTFWGEPTGVRDTVNQKQNVCAVRFFGQVGRFLIEHVNEEGLPGGLNCIGADSANSYTGWTSEGTILDVRTKFSGDPFTRMPAVVIDGVGPQNGPNNVELIRPRFDSDYYDSFAVRGCGAQAGGIVHVWGGKIENATVLSGSPFVTSQFGVGENDCDGSMSDGSGGVTPGAGGIWYMASDGTTVEGQQEAGGSGDITWNGGKFGSSPTNVYVASVVGKLLHDVDHVRFNDVYVAGGGNGAGFLFTACAYGCKLDSTGIATADTPITITSYPNAGQIAVGAIEINTHNNPVAIIADGSLGITCADGTGLINTTTGACQGNAAGLTGTVPCVDLPPLSGGDISSSGCTETILSNAVTNAKAAQAAANTVKGNPTGSTANEQDVVPATARSSSLLDIDQATKPGDANYTILATNRTLITSTALTTTRTWTLPAANAVNPGQQIDIADTGGAVSPSNTLTITAAGADTIGNTGAASVVWTVAGNSLSLKSDGTSKWSIISAQYKLTSISHQFVTAYSKTTGFTTAQPAASDVSGLAASATTDTTNASNITSGTLPSGRLPNPGASTLGGVLSAAAASHNFETGIDTSGNPTFAQPAASDVSGLATSATTDATNASNISSGTLAAARMTPSVNAHSYLGNNTGLSGPAAFVVPKCADLSDAAASCPTDTTNASNISSGTLPAGRLPNPTSSSLGGVQSIASASHFFMTSISTSGVPSSARPACTDLSDVQPGCNTLFHPGYIATRWYVPKDAPTQAAAGVATVANTVRCYPGNIPQKITIDRLGVKITTIGSSNVQLAIYASNSTDGLPDGAALVSTGSIVDTSTGAVNATVSQQLAAGNYWFCSNTNDSTAVFVSAAVSVTGPEQSMLGSSGQAGALNTATLVAGISNSQTFNTWPTYSSGSTWADISTATVPLLEFRVNSVP